MAEAIKALGLGKRYGEVRALRSLSFAMEDGTTYALLGPNGAGKSTTVRILTTLTTADEGEAVVAGHAARLAIVDGGEVVAEGTPEELKSGLRGDTLHVELASDEPEARVRIALERLDAVREVTLERRTLRARADDGARAVPLVLQQLE